MTNLMEFPGPETEPKNKFHFDNRNMVEILRVIPIGEKNYFRKYFGYYSRTKRLQCCQI